MENEIRVCSVEAATVQQNLLPGCYEQESLHVVHHACKLLGLCTTVPAVSLVQLHYSRLSTTILVQQLASCMMLCTAYVLMALVTVAAGCRYSSG
jgi:hypothetical protein